MSLGKQAKTLSKGQVEAVLGYLAKTRNPVRNRLIFLLSAKAGLRAKEIARLTWWIPKRRCVRTCNAGERRCCKAHKPKPSGSRSTNS